MSLENRREIIFLYDVRHSNPNGDPDEQNRPRMDTQDYNIVTDLRLKRTIRDYWLDQAHDFNKVLVRRSFNKDGKVHSMSNLVLDELKIDKVKGDSRNIIRDKLPEKFIDVRTFGVTAPVKDANVSITGPVQFAIGKSMNKPNILTIPITSSVSSGEGKGSGAMGEFHIVDYSLIKFHGIACEYNAKVTKFNELDLKYLFEGMWKGTKRLNTRSKFNHVPRLLLSVVSKEKEFQIGDLDQYIKLKNELDILETNQVEIIIDGLISRLNDFKSKIDRIELAEDGKLTFIKDGISGNSLKEFLDGFKIVDLDL